MIDIHTYMSFATYESDVNKTQGEPRKGVEEMFFNVMEDVVTTGYVPHPAAD